jgi:hypothetical protein
MNTLSPLAQKVIEKYLALPLGAGCSTPYFNNRRKRIRGGLRALVGKGAPEEIAEEAEMFSIRERAGIKKMESGALKRFLVDHNLGIDCSGLAYQVLEAESLARTGKRLRSAVRPWSGFKRRLLHIVRPSENSGVSTFSHSQNSIAVSEADIRAGDFISIIGTGAEKKYNHMMVVESVEASGSTKKINYIHSYMWPEDGLYDHGVRRGIISIENDTPIISGVWTEKGKMSKDNYTFMSAQSAKDISIRRLRVFASMM